MWLISLPLISSKGEQLEVLWTALVDMQMHKDDVIIQLNISTSADKALGAGCSLSTQGQMLLLLLFKKYNILLSIYHHFIILLLYYR